VLSQAGIRLIRSSPRIQSQHEGSEPRDVTCIVETDPNANA